MHTQCSRQVLTVLSLEITEDMALVSYSDSEGSGSELERQPSAANTSRSSTATGKPSFKKVVDRSNPHKIRVSLPEPPSGTAKEDKEEQGPPTKKAKVGSGAFRGFNSFLPAPKRDAVTNVRPKSGLGRGVSLKTGSAPGFSREPMSKLDVSTEDHNGGPEVTNADSKEDISRLEVLEEHAPGSEVKERDIPKKGNVTMFKPLSVARKPKKKNPITTDSPLNKGLAATTLGIMAEPAKRVSLFSSDDEKVVRPEEMAASEPYQPMLYPSVNATPTVNPTSQDGNNPYTNSGDEGETDPAPSRDDLRFPETSLGTSQSLDNIAADLNLSSSAKRQLFGRNKSNQSAINVVNFDTDREYAANELLRQAGEQAQHNPVRAIAPGKHSLKQLVNAASNQKDALEEHFASGRRNKKEAGSKYGW